MILLIAPSLAGGSRAHAEASAPAELPGCPSVMNGSQAYAFDGDPRGPFECFGACGPSCEHRGCSEVVTRTAARTLVDASGASWCRSCSYHARQCGTHEACRWHDAAIAGCGADYPPGGGRWQELGYRMCKRTADAMMAGYSPDKLASWATGGGPWDGYLVFSQLAETSWSAGPCLSE